MQAGNSFYQFVDGPVTCETYRILHGANYFSGGPVILFRINLGVFDEVFTNQIPGFYEALAGSVPSLVEHHCSEGIRGGFFMRVKDGTLLGHVMEHTAIELQELAGMHVSYGKTRSTKVPGVYNVIFRFRDADAGILAGFTALNWINSFLNGAAYDLKPAVIEMIRLREMNLLGPTTQSIADEAHKRKIPYLRLDEYNLVQLGSGKYQRRIRSSLTQHTSAIAADIIRDRFFVLKMLSSQGIPVVPFAEPSESICSSFPEILVTYRNRVTGLGDQKLFGKAGTLDKLRTLFMPDRPLIAFSFQREIPVYRFLVIRSRVVAVCRVVLPSVSGNGCDTVRELICIENNKTLRTEGDKGSLGKIPVDNELKNQLHALDLEMDSVPLKGSVVYLHATANPANGCATCAYKGPVDPELLSVVEKSCNILNIDVAGVDVMLNNPAEGIKSKQEGILEIFSSPNFRMHLSPFEGEKNNVAAPFIDYLFEGTTLYSAPLIAVGGSLCREAFMEGLQKYYNSLKTKAGFYFEKDRDILSGSAATSVSLLMQNPENERIVVEISISQIDNDGLPYSFSDVAVILGIDPAELRETEYYELEDLSYAYSVIAEETPDNGFVILNYDDPEVREMATQVAGDIIWISKTYGRRLIDKLKLSSRGKALVLLDDFLVSYEAGNETRMRKIANSNDDDKSLLVEMAILALIHFVENRRKKPLT